MAEQGRPADARPLTEDDLAPTSGPAAVEHAAAALAADGVRTAVVRLALVTHSRPHRPGPAGGLAAVTRRSGVSGTVGDGRNRWPAAASADVARLFRLALEHDGSGRTWHAVAEEGVPLREIATAVGARLGVPVAPVAPADLDAHFGGLAALVGLDVPASSVITRRDLGWTPTGPTLLEDLAAEDFLDPASVGPGR